MSPQLGSALVPTVAAARRRVWAAVLVAGLVVAIASVTAVAPRLLTHHRSSHQASYGSTANMRFPTTFDATLTEALRLGGGELELLPPPAGAQATAAVSWRQALNTCRTSGALCFPNLTAHVYLADFTKAHSQPIARLAWIIDFPAARCSPFGHPPALSSPPPSAQPAIIVYDCRIVNIIDAQTGALLWSLRDSTP